MRPPSRPRSRARVGVAAALATGVLVGCGQAAVLDVDRAEARIAASLGDTFDVDVGAVDCPDEVEVEQGARFSCTAEVGEATLVVEVVQTDDDGALRVEPTQAVLVTSRVEADIAEVLADRFDRADVEVTCPGGPQRLAPPDATFTCTAVDGDERKDVEVRVRDAQGALTYTLR